jgi:hypothetical protein
MAVNPRLVKLPSRATHHGSLHYLVGQRRLPLFKAPVELLEFGQGPLETPFAILIHIF